VTSQPRSNGSQPAAGATVFAMPPPDSGQTGAIAMPPPQTAANEKTALSDGEKPNSYAGGESILTFNNGARVARLTLEMAPGLPD